MKALIFITILVATNFASASYLEHCKLSGKVQTIEPLQIAQGDEVFAHRQLSLLVRDAKNIGGSHSDCSHHIGQTLSIDLKSVSLQDLALLNVGSFTGVDYFYVNSMSPTGIVESTKAQLDSQSLLAYQYARGNKDVGEAIARTQRMLGEGVEFKVGKVEQLPSFCGFAGCSHDYIVMLTYGINDSSSTRATIVVSLHIEALGDVTGLNVIQDPSLMPSF